jgi:outer membrane protein TolC
MTKKVIFSCFCFFCANFTYAQTLKLDLFQCIELASDSSLQAFRSKNMYLSGYWAYRAYKASYLPAVSFRTSPLQYNRNITKRYDYSENVEVYREQQSVSSSGGISISQNLPFTGGTFSIDSDLSYFKNLGSSSVSQYSSTPFRIGYSQTLFGFNDFKWERKIEPLKFEQAKKRLVYQFEEIAESAISHFFNLALAQKEYELASENVLSTDTLYRVGQEREKISAILQADLLLLELDAINAGNTLKNAALNLKRAQYALLSFLNRDENTPVSIDIPIPRKHVEIPVDEALLYAQENNPDYLAFTQEILEAEKSLEQTTKSASFNASISASIGFNQAAETLRGVYDNPSQQDVVSIGVTIPMLDWGLKKGRVNMAKNNLNVTQISVEQNKRNLEQEIISVIDNFNVQQDLLLSAEKSIELATAAYNTTKQRFIVGKSDVNSLTLTLNRRSETQRNYINTLKTYWLNYYQIRRLTLFDFEKRENLSDRIENKLKKVIINT